jgi:hypothetical protein
MKSLVLIQIFLGIEGRYSGATTTLGRLKTRFIDLHRIYYNLLTRTTSGA